jgi:hypothetical protein
VTEYFAGLDLGQVSDPSAVSILTRDAVADEAGNPQVIDGAPQYTFSVVHLERYPLATPYPQISSGVKSLMGRLTLRAGGRRQTLVIDGTGVGRAVVDMIIEANPPADIHPVMITAVAGEYHRRPWHGTHGPLAFWVVKQDLMGAALAALESGALKISDKLALAETLRNEMKNYRRCITDTGNMTSSARSGKHDDLLLATAIAHWVASQVRFPNYSLRGARPVPRDPPIDLRARRAMRADDQWHRRGDYADDPAGQSRRHRSLRYGL